MTDNDDDALVALYRRLPRSEPAAALDAAVLAGARAAARPRRPAWMAPLAAAAALALAVGVGWQIGHQPLREAGPATQPPAAAAATPAEPDSTADQGANAAMASARSPSKVAAMPAAQTDSRRAAVAAESAVAAAQPSADAADSAEAASRQRLYATRPAPDPGALAAARPPVSAPAPPAAASPPAPPEPPSAAAPPSAPAPVAAPVVREPAVVHGFSRHDERLDAIRALRDAGRRSEAIAALAELRAEDHALQVPADLLDLIE